MSAPMTAAGRRRPGIGRTGPFGKTMLPVGSEYAGKDGYVMVKVAEWPSRPGSKDNWRLKHRHVWELANGREVPRGHVVMFKDGDARNFDPANLACVPRGVMQRMNSAAAASPGRSWRDAESFETARLLAEIDIARTRAESETPRRCAVCGKEFVPERPPSVTGNYRTNRRTCRTCLDAGRKAGRCRG